MSASRRPTAIIIAELEEHFGCALGVQAISYEPRATGDQDPESIVTDGWLRRTTRHRRVRERLLRIHPRAASILAVAYTPSKALHPAHIARCKAASLARLLGDSKITPALLMAAQRELDIALAEYEAVSR